MRSWHLYPDCCRLQFMPTTTPQILPTELVIQILSSLPGVFVQSAAGAFWTIISTIWSSYWPFILPGMALWVVWELITRNGGFHYNSQNGFSPSFNRVVGAGVFTLFQGTVYVVIDKLTGSEAYYHIWPYPIHIATFFLTGLFLNLVGFWVYWKLPRI